MKISEAINKIGNQLKDIDTKENILDLMYLAKVGTYIIYGTIPDYDLSEDNYVTNRIKNFMDKVDKIKEKDNKNVGYIAQINGKKCGDFTLNVRTEPNQKPVVEVTAKIRGVDKVLYSSVVDEGQENQILEDIKVFGFDFKLEYKKLEVKDGSKIIGTIYYTTEGNKVVATLFNKYKLVDINSLINDFNSTDVFVITKLLKSIYPNLTIE